MFSIDHLVKLAHRTWQHLHFKCPMASHRSWSQLSLIDLESTNMGLMDVSPYLSASAASTFNQVQLMEKIDLSSLITTLILLITPILSTLLLLSTLLMPPVVILKHPFQMPVSFIFTECTGLAMFLAMTAVIEYVYDASIVWSSQGSLELIQL